MKQLISILASSSKTQNHDQQHSVVDLINYPVIAHTNAIKIFFIYQLFITKRARIITELIYSIFYLLSGLLVESAEEFKGRPLDLNVVSHRPSSDLASFQSIDVSFLAWRAPRISEISSAVRVVESTRTPDESRTSTSLEARSLSTWYRRFRRVGVSMTICPIKQS